MTQDEIIEMTRGLGICELTSKPKQSIHYSLTIHQMEALVKLIEEKTRKQLREEIIYTWVPPHFVDMAIESCAERAWIALVKHKQPWNVRQDVTEAIRARGEA